MKRTVRKPFLLLLVMLAVSGQFSRAYGQADNYKKQKNDVVDKVSDQEITFYLVFKSHFDIGYSALARDVVHEYRTSMIDKAMDVMDKNAVDMKDHQFVWTVPGWPLQQMLWDRQTPARRLRIERALKSGNLSTEVRLWVNDKGADDESGLVTPAWETRLPLQVGIATCPGGALPLVKEGVKVSRKGVLVTAYGNNPDGDGKLLRLWEEGGNDGKCEVTLPTDIYRTAQPVNLRGVPCGNPVAIKDGRFSISLGKFAPASFLLY